MEGIEYSYGYASRDSMKGIFNILVIKDVIG